MQPTRFFGQGQVKCLRIEKKVCEDALCCVVRIRLVVKYLWFVKDFDVCAILELAIFIDLVPVVERSHLHKEIVLRFYVHCRHNFHFGFLGVHINLDILGQNNGCNYI